MNPDELPLLRHRLAETSAFTPESLIAAVRAERTLPVEPVPSICVLEFDGDLTDWLVEQGKVSCLQSWACFHTRMYTVGIDREHYGIVPRTIGGPYAVLIAEQLKASGAKVVLGLTSAGRVSNSLPVPSLVVVTEAVRDEGTSYHYLSAAPSVDGNRELAKALAAAVNELGLPTFQGPVWTTDAPYRETQDQLLEHASKGILAVEMQAASLFAFSVARQLPVGIVAHVTNAIDHDDPFDKGSHSLGLVLLQAMCRGARQYLGG
jgi:uridine phosphorylase